MTNPPSGIPPAGVVRLGVSACLLGREFRYDGRHKRDALLVDVVGRWAQFVEVCPEVEIGMGIPRPVLHLVASADGVRMLTERGDADWTMRMRAWAEARVRALAELDLDGFVLKRGSPSCGTAQVKVYHLGSSKPSLAGVGLFASALATALPMLPVTDEAALNDAGPRVAFFERVLAWRRQRGRAMPPWSPRDFAGDAGGT